MEKQRYEELLLTDIVPNPLNPRKRFKGPAFVELTESIKSKGVLVPVLARPLGDKFELVAGERRFRAASFVAKNNGGIKGVKIPALVRDLSDDDAFDVMTIDNLQRENLNPLEEAEAFRVYVDKRGVESIDILAERTGISPSYIRSRVRVLDLPGYVKDAWENGTIAFGHVEQFARLKDPDTIKRIFEDMIKHEEYHPLSVKELRRVINNLSPSILDAPFDKKAAGCARCMSNSQVQKKLFDDAPDLKGSHCMNLACFKKNLKAWSEDNWEGSNLRKADKTAGVIFKDELDREKIQEMYNWDHVFPACKKCEKHLSVIEVDGTSAWPPRVCLDPVCYAETSEAARKKAAGREAGSDTTPARLIKSWHGEHFREKFYTVRIPEVVAEIPADSDNAHRLTLLALLHSNHDIAEIFAWGQKVLPESARWFDITNERLAAKVVEMPDATVRELLKEYAAAVIVQGSFGPKARHVLAPVLGISLAEEFCIDEEWIDKKTTAEILTWVDTNRLQENETFDAFLTGTLGKKPGQWKSCKKSELKRLILEAGVDLTGIVPDEIITVEKR